MDGSDAPDFIPLNKPVYRGHERDRLSGSKKRKSNGANNTPGPASKKKAPPLSAAVSQDPNLEPRVRDYLERNKDQEYIDVQGMARELHKRFPEYGRRKLKVFNQQVNDVFEMIASRGGKEGEGDDEDDDKDLEFVSVSTAEEEDETKVRTGMNSTMNALYSKSGPPKAKEEVSAFDRALDRADKINEASKKKPASSSKHQKPKDPTVSNSGGTSGVDADKAGCNGTAAVAAATATPTSGSARTPPPSPPPSTPSLPARSQSSKAPPKKNAASAVAASDASTIQNPAAKRSGSGGAAGVVNPKTTFSDVAGCKAAVRALFKATMHLVHPKPDVLLRVHPPRGCLIQGPPGCGKTMLAHATAGTHGLPMLAMAGTELVSGVSGDSERRIRDLFEQAKSMPPCLIFIDGLDVVAKKRENAQKDMEVRMTSQLVSCMDELNSYGPGDCEGQIFVIGATQRVEAIDPAVRQRLELEIPVGIPDVEARKLILEVMCKEVQLDSDVDFEQLARLTPGYVGSDLLTLIRQAACVAKERYYAGLEIKFSESYDGDEDVDFPYAAYSKFLSSAVASELSSSSLGVSMSDFEAARKTLVPTAMKEGFAMVPDVSFDDIGALDQLRHELDLAVVAPTRRPEWSRALGLDTSSGVLLCGPPGCGKTLLAKAMANQAGINFISVKGPELVNMYVGESERAVRQVFQRARNSAPCVIFFDEIDSICPKRSGHDGGSGANRIVNQLLTEMDGVHGRQGVFVMGATNRVDMIDEAILRPGRLTNVYFVDIPDARGRLDILTKLTKSGTRPKLAKDVDLAAISREERCESFSGADLASLVNRAASFRMEEMMREDGGEAVVSAAHFERALECVKPSVTGSQRRRYESMKRRYHKGGGGKRAVRSEQEESSKSTPAEKSEEEKMELNEEEDADILVLEEEEDDLIGSDANSADPSNTPPLQGAASSAASLRYLPEMLVTIREGSSTGLGGKQAVVVRVQEDEDGAAMQECTVRLAPSSSPSSPSRTDRTRCLTSSELEPSIPRPGERAKLLVRGGIEEVGTVTGPVESPESEEVAVRFDDGSTADVAVDLLCKVVELAAQEEGACRKEA